MYEEFAAIYDQIMRFVPYGRWAERIIAWINEYGISSPTLPGEPNEAASCQAEEKNIVVELGCGTGTMTELLAGHGFDMIGIDSSPAMLSLAMEKKAKNQSKSLYLCQKMQDFELYGCAGAFISVFDSLNYLLTEDAMLETFKRVKNYLYPGGVFVFDFNSAHHYEKTIAGRTIGESLDDYAYIWDDHYHPDIGLIEHDVSFFVKEDDGRFVRYQESHFQKGYSLSQVRSLLEKAGLDFITAVCDESGAFPDETSERIFVLARG